MAQQVQENYATCTIRPITRRLDGGTGLPGAYVVQKQRDSDHNMGGRWSVVRRTVFRCQTHVNVELFHLVCTACGGHKQPAAADSSSVRVFYLHVVACTRGDRSCCQRTTRYEFGSNMNSAFCIFLFPLRKGFSTTLSVEKRRLFCTWPWFSFVQISYFSTIVSKRASISYEQLSSQRASSVLVLFWYTACSVFQPLNPSSIPVDIQHNHWLSVTIRQPYQR